MKHPIFILSLLAAFLFSSFNTPPETDWTLKRRGDELWTYTRDKQGSNIKAVKLVMFVDADISDLNELLSDAELQPQWVYRCLEGRNLGGDPETGWFYYSRIDLPWPMEDRDMIGKVTSTQANGYYRSTTTSAESRIPKVEGCVRLSDFEIQTSYRRLSSGKTEVTYQIHSEPGGQVPDWLVNAFIDRGPIETMTRLREMVESRN